jgi:hypothetical protein
MCNEWRKWTAHLSSKAALKLQARFMSTPSHEKPPANRLNDCWEKMPQLLTESMFTVFTRTRNWNTLPFVSSSQVISSFHFVTLKFGMMSHQFCSNWMSPPFNFLSVDNPNNVECLQISKKHENPSRDTNAAATTTTTMTTSTSTTTSNTTSAVHNLTVLYLTILNICLNSFAPVCFCDYLL